MSVHSVIYLELLLLLKLCRNTEAQSMPADSRIACVAGLQHLRDVTDPEHPYTLEQLSVVTEELIDVSDADSYVRCDLSRCVR